MERLQPNREVLFHPTEMSLLSKLGFLWKMQGDDVVVIQRKLFPNWFVNFLRGRAGRIVFDFDDAIFVKSSGKSSSARMSKFAAICRVSDLIFAGNQYLADAAIAAGASPNNVHLIPTSVVVEATGAAIEKEDKPTLVWIGSSSTRRYLDFLTPTLERLGHQFPDLQLKVISDFEFQLDGMPVKNIPWSLQEEAAELASSHIGIAPMIDDPWTRGKCALKVLQYMGAGLPVISSRCGANQEVVLESETGFLAESEEEWCSAVETLIRDDAGRERLGVRGRQRVVELYSRDAIADRAVELLNT